MLPEPPGAGLGAAFRQALRALALRRPRADLRFGPGTAFQLLGLWLLLDLAVGWISVAGRFSGWDWSAVADFPRVLAADGLIATFAGFGALLLATWLAVRMLRRPGAFWSLLAPLLALWWLFSVLTSAVTLAVLFQADDGWAWYQRLRLAWLLLWLLLAWRLLAGFAPDTPRLRRLASVLQIAVFTVGGLWLYSWPDYWTPDYAALSERAPPVHVDQGPVLDHEAVMYAQPALLAQALDALPGQRPGVPDLYAIGFAGDGSESVFANEVRHFGALVASRYGAGERTLLLVNDPATATDAPIATLTALDAALAAVAARMDVEEDVLLLFLTTHGSEDHDLLVQLGDLPLTQVTPGDLQAALDASGIRWRILVVSACYSGGFVEPLADPYTLVLTAARADRTSFGCGAASDITWFGQAFLAEALNSERDPVAAFALAKDAISTREQAEGITPSEPQMHLGEAIAERLPSWLAAWPDKGPVPFTPP